MRKAENKDIYDSKDEVKIKCSEEENIMHEFANKTTHVIKVVIDTH